MILWSPPSQKAVRGKCSLITTDQMRARITGKALHHDSIIYSLNIHSNFLQLSKPKLLKKLYAVEKKTQCGNKSVILIQSEKGDRAGGYAALLRVALFIR